MRNLFIVKYPILLVSLKCSAIESLAEYFENSGISSSVKHITDNKLIV